MSIWMMNLQLLCNWAPAFFFRLNTGKMTELDLIIAFWVTFSKLLKSGMKLLKSRFAYFRSSSSSQYSVAFFLYGWGAGSLNLIISAKSGPMVSFLIWKCYSSRSKVLISLIKFSSRIIKFTFLQYLPMILIMQVSTFLNNETMFLELSTIDSMDSAI